MSPTLHMGLFDNEVGQLVCIVVLNREMFFEELAAAVDSCTERITGVTTVDTVGDGLDNSIPAVGRDNFINTTISQDMNPAFEERDEDENASFVAGVMQSLLKKGDDRLLLDFGADFIRVDEASSENGDTADQTFAREVAEGKEPQEMPERFA